MSAATRGAVLVALASAHGQLPANELQRIRFNIEQPLKHSAATHELRERAATLLRCVSKIAIEQHGEAAWLLTRDAGPTARGQIRNVFADGELWLCPPIQVGYVHIYKSGGTTIGIAFKKLCDMHFGVNSSFVKCAAPYCNVNGVSGAKEFRFLAKEYRYFSFVRRPDERLLSGIFQARKNQGGAGNEIKELFKQLPKSEFVKAVLTRVLSGHLYDPHLLPQVAFLMSDGAPMPSLVYLGRVENLSDDFAAITAEVFGVPTAATEARDLVNRIHDRDRHSFEYGRSDPIAELKVADMKHDTKAIMMGTYISDYMCLGYF